MDVLQEEKETQQNPAVETPCEQATELKPAVETPPEPARRKRSPSPRSVNRAAFTSMPAPTPTTAPGLPFETVQAPPQEQTPSIPPDRQAGVIGRALLPSMMATALQMDKYVNVTGYRQYLDQILEQAGNPTDPVEIMLLEQLVLAHLRAAQLQSDAGQAEGLEAMKLYNAAAVRLLAEFRRTALALKIYREPTSRPPEHKDSSSS